VFLQGLIQDKLRNGSGESLFEQCQDRASGKKERVMERTSQGDEDEKKMLDEEGEGRAGKADEAYCEACEEKGIKVSSWEEFDAWKKYVDGKIDEQILADKAETELAEFAKSFGKYLVIAKEDPTPSDGGEKKERVKHANKIYRKLCDATGLTLCFLNSFGTWSDFVDGKISEVEFLEKAKLEVEKMVKEVA